MCGFGGEAAGEPDALATAADKAAEATAEGTAAARRSFGGRKPSSSDIVRKLQTTGRNTSENWGGRRKRETQRQRQRKEGERERELERRGRE